MIYRRTLLLALSIALLNACVTQPASEQALVKHSEEIEVDALSQTYPIIKGEPFDSYLSYLSKRVANGLPENQRLQIFPSLLKSKKAFAYSTSSGKVLLSSALVLRLANEAELAFVMAHELSHISLGHSAKAIYNLDGQQRQDYEMQADKMAVGIIALAGYDPRTASHAIMHAYSQSAFINPTAKETSGDYPELQTRVTAVDTYVFSSAWRPPGTIDRRDFKLFIAALRSASLGAS